MQCHFAGLLPFTSPEHGCEVVSAKVPSSSPSEAVPPSVTFLLTEDNSKCSLNLER